MKKLRAIISPAFLFVIDFLTVADSYNEQIDSYKARIDSYNCRRQLQQENWQYNCGRQL